MRNQDALFPLVKNDINFDTLLTQAKAFIAQQSGQKWTQLSENDPGITLLEACCYGISDLAYRHSLPLNDLLTPKSETQTAGDTIFPQEFGPQKMLSCGPITAEDYRRALLDLHSNDSVNKPIEESSAGYFLFNDVQLIREPDTERYTYWYDKKKREYCFNSTSDSEMLALRGNYWLYLVPSRETETDRTLAQEILNTFLKNNRNLGEFVSKVIWLKPADLPLQMSLELDDEVSDIADIFAQIYMTTEYAVQAKPVRYTTESLREQGYNHEEIFSGPYLRHGWIPKLPQTKNYAGSTTLNLSHLVNQLLAIKGVKNITRLVITPNEKNTLISPLPNDKWSWNIDQGHYPRLWGNNPITLIASSKSPLKITVKGGVAVRVTQQQIEEKIVSLPLINTQPVVLHRGRHRKVRDYYPVSNKLPACYGLQRYASSKPQEQLHQFMLPFEQMLANGCAELDLLPELLAFKQRGNHVYGTQWPFKTDTVNQHAHQKIMPDLINKLAHDTQIENTQGINEKNYAKELAILNYLLSYFGAQRAIRPLITDPQDFLSTQRGYLAQQPELTYQRNNIRIDKVSALQKRIAARIGLGGECFSENPDLAKLPFYLIEHRQLLPIKPDKAFDTKQKPEALEQRGELLIFTQQGIADRLLQGQVINLIFPDGGSTHILRGQMITDVSGDTFSLTIKNSADLERNLSRIEAAFKDGNLNWLNSPIWLEDMDYQLVYASEKEQCLADDERWITSSAQSPFPAMVEEDDEITLQYKITPSGPGKYFVPANPVNNGDGFQLKARVVKFDRIQGKILIKRDKASTHAFPVEAEAWRYHWYFSNAKYALADRFSFVVSVVINRQLIEKEGVDLHKLESWVKTEILAEFPAHISMVIHWLSPDQFKNFARTYQRWQNNGAPLGDEAYRILETLNLGRLPSAAIGIGNMRIATTAQRIEVIGDSGTQWNEEKITNNQLNYVPYTHGLKNKV
ncbi:hypothetical protein Xmau_00916 [Xenorhabdus mauleonii]|uniref:Uncharacterized protein n=1 Tax=Xenorhabdus mauleonii TaxID=351675 RepID=A0A1I3LPZ6_9GAMM|nr:hypothetical protein [Xenorhabdus mauleonii]PHM45266.1 hypothetical protein Xmau_00916 [Xenorhabdus mauleonii]SFI86818.1 hypothetical protein SAMN05421680_10433 [Xenorhabdus mauleonii]